MGHLLVVSLKMIMKIGGRRGGCEPGVRYSCMRGIGRVGEVRREFNGTTDNGLFGREQEVGEVHDLLMAMGSKEASYLQILFFFFLIFISIYLFGCAVLVAARRSLAGWRNS